MEDFCSALDRAWAESGPPALFMLTVEGVWRLEPDLSRDGWERVKPELPPRLPGHGLMRDLETGFVTRIYVTGRVLMDEHPRVEVQWFDDADSARAALVALGRPPLRKEPWG